MRLSMKSAATHCKKSTHATYARKKVIPESTTKASEQLGWQMIRRR